MPQCAACGAETDPKRDDCPVCGVPVRQATASFEPVGDHATAQDHNEDVEGPVLVVRKGPQPGERFFIDRSPLSIGRDPESDIFLNDMTVSRSHAVLDLAGGRVSVSDSGSLNGTYVNGVCVDSATLSSGDVLQIGTFQMLFFGAAGTER